MAPMAKLDNEELGRLKEVNIDEASARRHVRDSLKDVQLNLDHILFKTLETGIKTKESYEVNSRGVEIFSKSWLPEALYIRMMNTQMDLWETSMLANKLKNIHDHLSETSLRLCYRHIEKQRSSESLKALHSLFDTTHIDNMKILTSLIHPKPHITPLQDGMTKRKVHMDVLRRKTVLLLISLMLLLIYDLNVKECANNQKV